MGINDLTKQEHRMLSLIVRGKRSKGIARAMGLTVGTVRVYLHYLYRRLRVQDMTAAALWYQARRG